MGDDPTIDGDPGNSADNASQCEPVNRDLLVELDLSLISDRKSPEHQRRDIIQYVELETEGENVTYLEKLTSEVLHGTEHAVWDVRTNLGEWWVVTNPTNLYEKQTFPSVDMLLSFHIGLTARMFARNADTDDARGTLLRTLRRLDVVSEALDQADEAEDFQAVAVRCREALLSFIREVARVDMLTAGQEEPKMSDFIHWSEVIANWSSPNSSLARIRSYLKAVARETWQVVNWLTHATGARGEDAAFAFRATSHTIFSFLEAMKSRDAVSPERCPRCDSYQLFNEYRADDQGEVKICEMCGWEGPLRR